VSGNFRGIEKRENKCVLLEETDVNVPPNFNPAMILTCAACNKRTEVQDVIGRGKTEVIADYSGWYDFQIDYPEPEVRWLCPGCYQLVLEKVHSLVEMLGNPHVTLTSLLPYEERWTLFDKIQDGS
jgi:hypothetical protein